MTSGPAPGQGSSTRTVLTTAASHLALPLSAVLTGPILARALGPEARGELAAVLAPIFLAALVFTAGLPEASTYLVASKRHGARRTAEAAAVMAGVLGVLAAVAVYLVAPALLRNSPDQVPLLRALALLLPLTLAGLALRGVVHGRSDFPTLNAERWASVLSRLVVIAALALAGVLTVTSAAWVTNGTALAAAAYLLWRARHLLRRGPADAAPAPRPWRALLLYGVRVWAGSLSVLLVLRVDQVLMAPLTAAEQLGYYAVAVAVAELPGAAFNAVRDLVFASSSSRQDAQVVAMACRLSIALLGPVCLLLVLVAPPVVVLVFGREFAPASEMARVLFIAAVPAGVATVAGAGLMGMGRPGRLGAVQGVVAVANIVLVLVLVPPLGGLGAALASLAAYVLLAAGAAVLLTRASGERLRDLLVPRASDLRQLAYRLRRTHR